MSLQRKLQPYLSQVLTSDKLKNSKRNYHRAMHKLLKLPHAVDFYIRVDDPYSVLLLQMLPAIQHDFHVRIRPHVIADLPQEFSHEQQTLEPYAIRDAQYLAKFYRLNFGYKKAPTTENTALATRILLKHAHSSQFLKIADSVMRATWGNDRNRLEKLAKLHGVLNDTEAQTVLQENQQSLIKNGHYLTGTVLYDGEWYWGIDRLGHLTQRLSDQRLANRNVALSIYQKAYLDLHKSAPVKRLQELEKPTVDFYFSFRSPYAYIALLRIYRLQHRYKININIKPVLSIVDDNHAFAHLKNKQVLLDAKREADMHHIPFGKICDPQDEGVKRAMGAFTFAQGEGKAREYLQSICRGIWAEGRDLNNESDMQYLIERADLDWEIASQYLYDESWHDLVENNRKDLNKIGLWGVPTFKFGKLVIWGQDRLWLLEDHICSLVETETTESA